MSFHGVSDGRVTKPRGRKPRFRKDMRSVIWRERRKRTKMEGELATMERQERGREERKEILK